MPHTLTSMTQTSFPPSNLNTHALNDRLQVINQSDTQISRRDASSLTSIPVRSYQDEHLCYD